MSLEEKLDKLVEKYEVLALDDKTHLFRKCFNFDEAAKIRLDWHSTQIFSKFMDALDIDKPRGSKERSDNNISKSKQTFKEHSQINNSKAQIASTNDKQVYAKNNQLISQEIHKSDKPKEETILSAEALKILSELPDLSYMRQNHWYNVL